MNASELTLHLDASGKDASGASVTVAAFKAALADQFPKLSPLLPACRVAVDEGFAEDADPITQDSEVALIPPVSGGVGRPRCWLQSEPVTLAPVLEAVQHPGAGAVTSFVGTVRNQTGPHAVSCLDYEAYQGMAERVLADIADRIQGEFSGTSVSIVHRTGRLVPGEIAVAIAVSAPHRDAAFSACRAAIEAIKEDVPIWKKETRGDGSVWVGMGS